LFFANFILFFVCYFNAALALTSGSFCIVSDTLAPFWLFGRFFLPYGELIMVKNNRQLKVVQYGSG